MVVKKLIMLLYLACIFSDLRSVSQRLLSYQEVKIPRHLFQAKSDFQIILNEF